MKSIGSKEGDGDELHRRALLIIDSWIVCSISKTPTLFQKSVLVRMGTLIDVDIVEQVMRSHGNHLKSDVLVIDATVFLVARCLC
jgi:hypothetical protein